MPDFEQICHRLFSDSSWLAKCLIGALLMAVPILNLFAFGYIGLIGTQPGRGEPFHLPEWEDWRELFVRGLGLFVILLVWAGGLFLAAWLVSVPFQIWASFFGYVPWASLFAWFPFAPAIALAPPLAAAGWYRYLFTGEMVEGLKISELLRLMGRAGFSLVLPTLAFLGFLLVGLPLFPLAFFVGGLVVFYFYSSIFCHAEERRTGNSDSSFSVL